MTSITLELIRKNIDYDTGVCYGVTLPPHGPVATAIRIERNVDKHADDDGDVVREPRPGKLLRVFLWGHEQETQFDDKAEAEAWALQQIGAAG